LFYTIIIIIRSKIHALIESAVEFSEAERAEIEAELKEREKSKPDLEADAAKREEKSSGCLQ